jgi:2-methylisocitrate lyase-like PEP mutase family enzyme
MDHSILHDERFHVPVPAAPSRSEGVAWLRSQVVRFSEGAAHRRRRAVVDGILSAIEPSRLDRSGDHLATLAEALGLPRTVATDVRLVARSYHPHTEVTPGADDAVARLVHACGGRWDERTANVIGVLVQACDATARLIDGEAVPVPTTRRVAPDGREVVVDLGAAPFGAGRHECPGRDHALALCRGASRFHRLHDGPGAFVLPNAWDVASAALLVQAGFAAIGTTSLGVAAGSGVPDGHGLTSAATMALARSLVRLPVPITVDLEGGWGGDLVELAAELGAIGVAGVNVEDGRRTGLAPPDEQAVLIADLKRGSPGLFVNARIDTFWLGQEPGATVERARRYVDAGADGIFVPGLTDEAAIAGLADAVDAPLNVLAGGAPERLAALGVRRISTGSLLYRTALAAARDAAVGVRRGAIPAEVLPYGDVDRLAGLW